jgi:hypothetical protein
MKRYILLLVALLSVTAVSVVAVAPALAAEPKTLFLLFVTFPVFLNAADATSLIELGAVKGNGYQLGLEETAAGVATYGLTFTNMKRGSESCNTPGDIHGAVLITRNPYHLVFDSLSPLGVAGLFSVEPELTIECGVARPKIKGNFLGLIGPIESEEIDFRGNVHCLANGEPAEVKYWPNNGVELVAQLLGNFGLGFKKTCLNITGEVPFIASWMIQIMG